MYDAWRWCGGDAAPYMEALATGKALGGSTDPVYGAVAAIPLCPEDETVQDMDVLWETLQGRLESLSLGNAHPFDDANIAAEVDAELNWRNVSKSVHLYLPDPVGCAEYARRDEVLLHLRRAP